MNIRLIANTAGYILWVEAGFLLLTSHLGKPDRRALTTAQLRNLGERMKAMTAPSEDRELELGDLVALGYGYDMAERILALLEEGELLEHYPADILRFENGENLGRLYGRYEYDEEDQQYLEELFGVD